MLNVVRGTVKGPLKHTGINFIGNIHEFHKKNVAMGKKRSNGMYWPSG